MMGTSSRAGKEHRVNTERYFHVMGQGWYVLTREGASGPYTERNEVNSVIKQLVDPDAAPVEKKSEEEESRPRWEDFFLR